jgi:hypothetical protein
MPPRWLQEKAFVSEALSAGRQGPRADSPSLLTEGRWPQGFEQRKLGIGILYGTTMLALRVARRRCPLPKQATAISTRMRAEKARGAALLRVPCCGATEAYCTA